MSEQHPGLFGFFAEANEIKERLGVSAEEAFRLQREAADARLEIYEAEAESSAIPFRAKH
jgi:hypothetical protein